MANLPLAAALWPSRSDGFAGMLRLVAMGIGHIVILAAGFAWLAFGVRLGIEKAWMVGVLPFLAASVIKNALGAVLIPAIRRSVDRRG